MGRLSASLLEYYGVPLPAFTLLGYINMGPLRKSTGGDHLPDTYREFIDLRDRPPAERSPVNRSSQSPDPLYNTPLLMNNIFVSETQRLTRGLGLRWTLTIEQARFSSFFVNDEWTLDSSQYSKTWSQVRDITLARLNAQPQDKPSLRVALKRINDIQIAIVRKKERALENLAEKTGQNPEEVAFIFQSGEGSENYPDLQNDTDVVNGLYQIESALHLELKNP